MRSILLVSHWFYPGRTPLLVWLAWIAVLALVLVVAGWISRGLVRRCSAIGAAALCGIGGLACLAMITAETTVFEFGSPEIIAAYAVLLATFFWMYRQSRSQRALKLQAAGSFLVASATITFLFFFGIIPYIVELQPGELRNVEGVNVLGRSSGTLLITEFADFQCPACAMQDEAMDQLWKRYPDRIRYSFRHLPRQRHRHAAAAALASQCAAENGHFWETKRLLFANQDRLGEIVSAPDLPTIPAGQTEHYARCVESKSAWGDVLKDLAWAENLGLTRTPSIIVGNKLIQGMISYPRLALIVRRELEAHNLRGTQPAAATTDAGCGLAAVKACSD